MNRRSALATMVSGATAVAVGKRAIAGQAKNGTSSDVVGVLYDSTLCVGCRTCMGACKEANGLPPGAGEVEGVDASLCALSDTTKTIVNPHKHGDAEYFLKQQCMHCLDPGCVSACMLGALKKDQRGIVYWDGSVCVGCRYCQVACPFGVPKFEWSSNDPRIVKCEMCRPRLAAGKLPACVEACPSEAVIFGKREDLLKEAHRRLKESPENYVQKVYGEHDAGGTQVLVLSHIDFEKLGLPDVGMQPAPKTTRDMQESVYYGFLAPAALYGVIVAVVWRNHRAQKMTQEEPVQIELPGTKRNSSMNDLAVEEQA